MRMHFDAWYTLRLSLDEVFGRQEALARQVAGRVRWGQMVEGRPTVLCLDRAMFIKDIAEMQKRTNLNLPCLHVKEVKWPQEKWVPARLRRQTFLGSDLRTKLPRLREGLRKYGVALLNAISKQHKIDAVMAANTDYWQDEAVRLACTTLGIPFLVMSRESYAIGRGRKYVSDVYAAADFQFQGAGCLVASKSCEAFFSAQPGMAGRPVRATGWPRYDAWLDSALPPLNERKTYTLLAYGDPSSYHYAEQNFREVLVSFAAAIRKLRAAGDKSSRFVVKLKKGNEGGYINAAVPDLNALGVEVRADIPLPELFAESRLVVGYNTLAILEGLLGDSAVVVPFWGDAERAKFETLLHPDEPADAEVCYFARNRADFETLLERSFAGDLPAKSTREARLARFSRHSLVSGAETSSARAESFIRGILNKPARNQAA
jgi:hypothetical protein